MDVVGCLLECKGTFLTLLRKPDDGNCWGLPAGGVHAGETPLQAMVRELREETGHQILESSLAWVTEMDWEFPHAMVHFIVFRAIVDDQISLNINPDEHVAWKWVTPIECSKFPNLISGFKELLSEVYKIPI